jgi:hypothetical protein
MIKRVHLTAISLFLFGFLFLIQFFGKEMKALSSMINDPEGKVLYSFPSGERLEFSIKWMGMNAGTAILEVGKPVMIGSNKAVPITSIARSNDFISRFFPVEDKIESFIDTENLVPLEFKIYQREGRRVKSREVHYDQVNHKVLQVEEGKEETFNIEPGTQDALSVLYFFRTLEFPPPGESSFIKVYEGGKNWDLEIKVLGKEAIETPIGSFNTVKTVAMAKYEGIFLNKGDITVWFTDDARHVPVQMQSKVTIGSVAVLLVSKQDGRNP